MVKEESEKSVEVGSSKATVKGAGTPRFHTDSTDSFWSSYPTSELTPEQRRHFKTIMRKEGRSNGGKRRT